MTGWRARAADAFTAFAALACLWTFVTWLNGGFTVSIAGIRLTSNNLWRPLAIAGALALGVIALQGLGRTAARLSALVAGLSPDLCAAGLAIVVSLTGLWFGSWTASGPDSFAYVSQAALWRDGPLSIPVPLAAEAPWPDALETFVPFGYTRASDGSSLVPVTAPGLPMLMALLQLVIGHTGAFLITPIAGGLLVWFTFLIGRRLGSPATGLIAAWLVATSPAVIFMLMWPMSDVPTAAIAAVMLWFLLQDTTASAVGAGVAGSAGILVRPTFATIVAAAVAWLVADALVWRAPERRRRWNRLMGFVIALFPGIIAIGILNSRWYGGPLASGYGTAGTLLSLGRLRTNGARYLRWLIDTSPIALVGLVTLALPMSRLWRGRARQRIAWLLLATVAAGWSVYLVYTTFSDWWYLRFLLPIWPAIFLATAVAMEAMSRTRRSVAWLLWAVVITAGLSGVAFARSHRIFDIGAGEQRYATIAQLVDAATEPDAVILTGQHAGTVRYYAGRETLRFDYLDPAWLDRALAWLTDRGRHPYVLVEDWEQPEFETRFGGGNLEGTLSYSPTLAWESGRAKGWVYLYDPRHKNAVTTHPGPEVEQRQPFSANPTGFPSRR